MTSMRAWVLERAGTPLELVERPIPEPEAGEILLEVKACAVCRTDLHLQDGDLPDVPWPVVPGHEIVGEVVRCGEGVTHPPGLRLGVPWLGYTCGGCSFCSRGQENLCDGARFTGYQIDGGFSEYTIADHRYCFPIDDRYDDASAAPLLCAGLIGYRSFVMAGDAERIGIYGFGAAAHIITQVACKQGREILAFTRPGDAQAQQFARELGASWAGDSTSEVEPALDAAIIFAPIGPLVPVALRNVRKGGIVVCGGIHMSDIPSFPYSYLWGERVVRSVANLTRRDGEEFLRLAPEIPVRTKVKRYGFEDANRAMDDLRAGALSGAAVLVMAQ